MKTTYTDEQIVSSIKASTETREQVFEYLFLNQELKNMVFSKVNKMRQDATTAEDIFLDSLLAFIKNVQRNKFNAESKVSTYIVGIASFQCLRYLDKQKREQGKADQYQVEQMRTANAAYETEAEFLLNETKRYEASLTRKVYRQLSDTCRRVLRQKYGQALSVKEIAAQTGDKIQSIKNSLSRCYKKLRIIIQNDSELMEELKKNYGKL